MPLGHVPPSFVRNVSGAFPDGASWLRRLPMIFEACLAKWNLIPDGDPFDLSYHYVAPVVSHEGTPAVLKLGVTSSPELAAEARALSAFAGAGAVRLLRHDEVMGALLLERVSPGCTLASLHDEKRAAGIAAQTMVMLRRAPLSNGLFPSLERWTNGFEKLRERYSGTICPIDPDLISTAEEYRMELLRSTETNLLLHADLHHFNLLHGDHSGWVAIDPKGVIGDPAYEPAPFLLNPEPAAFLDKVTQQSRIAVFADKLDIDPKRITTWAFVHAVLAAWWTIEGGGADYSSSVDAAHTLLSLLH